MTLAQSELTRALEELITALDRRVPRIEQAGEAAIARDAAALRTNAINRLAELAHTRAIPADTTGADVPVRDSNSCVQDCSIVISRSGLG